jgi:hypothetical protein
MGNFNDYESKKKYLMRNIMEVGKEIVKFRLKVRKLKHKKKLINK